MKDARAREDANLEQAVHAADAASKAESLQVPVGNEVAQEARQDVVPETQMGLPMPTTNQSENFSWDESLEENNVHDIVSDDSEMYDAIDRIPKDSDSMADQVMAIVQNRVSEVWSPARV